MVAGRTLALLCGVVGVVANSHDAQSRFRTRGPLPHRDPPEAVIDLGRDAETAGPGSVLTQQKISSTRGGLEDTLDSDDWFGASLASLGDVDGDGVDDLAAGAPLDDDGGEDRGAVYVLFLNADGTVKAHQKISSEQGGFSGSLDDVGWFGSAVAGLGDLNGDGIPDLAVGAKRGRVAGVLRGTVWVLSLNADGTVKSHRKIANGLSGFTGVVDYLDFFGSSVAALGDLDGDGVCDLAVGATGDDDGGVGGFQDFGAVWVLFLEPNGRVKAQQKISALEGGFTGPLHEDDAFGTSVAGLGDLDGDGVPDLAVGAEWDDDGGNNGSGAVWVLFLEPDGTVRAHQKISAVEGGFSGALEDLDHFGHSVAALSLGAGGPHALAVGVPGDDDGETFSSSERGAVWLLSLEPDGTVGAYQKISTTQGGFSGALSNGDQFGSSVSMGDLDGDGSLDLMVGAIGDDDGGPFSDRGATWGLFLDPDGAVREHQKISNAEGGFPSTLDDSSAFGQSVTTLGDLDGDAILDLAVGSADMIWVLFPNADGSVRFHETIDQVQLGYPPDMAEPPGLGTAVGALGDLDGDGISELVAGTYRDFDGGPYRGAVWVLFLNADGTLRAHQKISALQGGFTGVLDEGDEFGSSVAALGDLDGDGVVDLAVGAPGDDDGGGRRGAVWVLFLNTDATVRTQQKISDTEGGFSGVLLDRARFGSSVAALGDLDGDGVRDLAVGAPGRYDGGVTGTVWVLFLEPDGTLRTHQEISAGEGGFSGMLEIQDVFGGSLATIDDLSGDGIPDLLVGAIGDDDGGHPDVGAVWVLFLNADGTVAAHQQLGLTQGGLAGPLNDSGYFGSSVASLGDLDGDGVSDLAAGAFGDDDGGYLHGALWLLSLDGIATLDFEVGDDQPKTQLVNGQDVSSPPAFGRTVALASSGANLGPAIFDSTPSGPNDPGPDDDLLVGRGNVLILQSSVEPTQTVPGVFDRPDDDQDGGTLSFSFQQGAVAPLSLDLVDIDLGSGQTTSVVLFDVAGHTRIYSIQPGWTEDLVVNGPPGWRTLDLRNLDVQQGFVAPATASEFPGFDERAVTRIEVHLGGPGAVDGLRWDPHPRR